MRNNTLKKKIGSVAVRPNLVAAAKVPAPNTVNKQGHAAYALPEELKLVSMLNTLKLEPQYYRTETEQLRELRQLIDNIGKKDPYFVAQAIVYSRCVGEKMRSVNQAAAIFLAKYISGTSWADRFYSIFNKKEGAGGCIYRPDDMSQIAEAFKVYTKKNITNAMKRGFATALRSLDTYSLLKYKNDLIDIINLVHPLPHGSATVKVDGKIVPVFEAIVKGYKVSADTWEANNSEAGQIVAAAKKEGKITQHEADELLLEAKSANWNGLLQDNKLPILAALRNIRNILKDNPSQDTITMLCKLITNGDIIKRSGVFPYQIDIAREVVLTEFGHTDLGRTLATALLVGYEASIPNFKLLFSGRTLVILDVSASMNKPTRLGYTQTFSRSSALEKGSLLAATIALGANADIIRFGSGAEYVKYDPNENVFNLSRRLHANLGSTNLASALRLANGTKYDRVVIISDQEVNRDNTYAAYKDYLAKNGQPYIYSLDLCSYGTTQILGDKVMTFFGYGYAMFEAISTTEFNPMEVIDKVRKIVI